MKRELRIVINAFNIIANQIENMVLYTNTRSDFMFDENSVIYATFMIEENNFEKFLDTYFDNNGACLINGVSISKQESIAKMKKIKEKNFLLKEQARKMESEAFCEALKIEGLSQREIPEEALNEHMERMKNPKFSSINSLSVAIKLDVMKYNDEYIKNMIISGYLLTGDENALGVTRIYLDISHYALESLSPKTIIDNPFIPSAEKKKIIDLDIKKRENIIVDILKYKRKFTSGENDGTRER